MSLRSIYEKLEYAGPERRSLVPCQISPQNPFWQAFRSVARCSRCTFEFGLYCDKLNQLTKYVRTAKSYISLSGDRRVMSEIVKNGIVVRTDISLNFLGLELRLFMLRCTSNPEFRSLHSETSIRVRLIIENLFEQFAQRLYESDEKMRQKNPFLRFLGWLFYGVHSEIRRLFTRSKANNAISRDAQESCEAARIMRSFSLEQLRVWEREGEIEEGYPCTIADRKILTRKSLEGMVPLRKRARAMST